MNKTIAGRAKKYEVYATFFLFAPLPAAVEEAEVPFCVGFKEDGFNLRQRLILLKFLLV